VRRISAVPGRTLTRPQQGHNSARAQCVPASTPLVVAEGGRWRLHGMHTLKPSNPTPAPAGHSRFARQLRLAAAWRGRSTFSGMPHCRSPLDADPTPAGQGRSAGQRWLRGWRRPGTAGSRLLRYAPPPQAQPWPGLWPCPSRARTLRRSAMPALPAAAWCCRNAFSARAAAAHTMETL